VAIGMEPYFGEAALLGLHRYVRRVNRALGLHGDAFCVHMDPTAGAYIALDRRLPDWPDRDAALIWTERHGWAMAVETNCGEDLVVVGYLGGELLSPPRAVAEFAQEMLAGNRSPRCEDPPSFRDEGDLAHRLAAYPASEEALAFSPGVEDRDDRGGPAPAGNGEGAARATPDPYRGEPGDRHPPGLERL
jgi:hypothetical protein